MNVSNADLELAYAAVESATATARDAARNRLLADEALGAAKSRLALLKARSREQIKAEIEAAKAANPNAGIVQAFPNGRWT